MRMGLLRQILIGREKDERVNAFGFVPKAEKQRVRRLHAAERTAKATEALARQPKAPKAYQASVADELAKLAALRKQGVLTDAEFETQKKRLLAGE
jgi:hypothetical protein